MRKLPRLLIWIGAIALTIAFGWLWWFKSSVGYGTCRLTIEHAASAKQQTQGLVGRMSLGKNHAMLFNFASEVPTFWMKEMRFPIDIVWIAEGKIVGIEANVPPDDGAKTYPAPKPVDWVLETSANRFAECGVKVGDTVAGLK